MCALIRPLWTDTRVVLVRHVLEQAKHSNTGRLAALVLDNHVLLTHGGPRPMDPEELGGPGAYLLFPEGPAALSPPEPRPRRLVVLDGSWAQARRMRQRIAALRGMPIWSLAPGHERRRLRRAPRPGAMATIESIAAALGLLGEAAAAAALERAFDLMIERSGDPAGGNSSGHPGVG